MQQAQYCSNTFG